MLVERLTRADKVSAVEVLAAAFHDYPAMRSVLRDAGADYPARLRALVGFFCETRLTRGYPLLGVREAGKLVAVAGVNDPEPGPWPPELRGKDRELLAQIGPAAHQRLQAFDEASLRHEPVAPHHYLGILGVRPDRQGRGHARTLVEHVRALSESHPRSAGVSLSTERAGNVPFYRHLGFEVLGEADVEDVHTWCLFLATARPVPPYRNSHDPA